MKVTHRETASGLSVKFQINAVDLRIGMVSAVCACAFTDLVLLALVGYFVGLLVIIAMLIQLVFFVMVALAVQRIYDQPGGGDDQG